MKLILQTRPEGIGAVASQIIVEIAVERRERHRLDPEALCSGGQAVSCTVPGRVAIPDDIEPAQRRREQDGSEVSGRKRRQHRHAGQNLTGRQHGLDALAGGENLSGGSEADSVPEKDAHRPPRCFDSRLAGTVRGEPGAMRAGLLARKIGDGRNECRPDLGG